jgi:hypothetical protein
MEGLMAQPNFSILLSEDEQRAFEALVKKAYPGMKRGGKSALFRDWLYQAAEAGDIEIKDKTVYGAPAGNQRALKSSRD